MKRIQILFAVLLFLVITTGICVYWAYGTPQTNTGMSQTQIARNTYNEIYGAEQVTILAQIATSPQTNTGMSLTQFARNIYDNSYGAKQVIISTSTGKQIPFINTTSLSEGDLLYYDSINMEWNNSQGQISLSGIDSSPNLILKNPTEEDTDGGRESSITWQGEQSGGEISTLSKIQISHDGTGDDEKAQLEIFLNDGDDGNSPTLLATILRNASLNYWNWNRNTYFQIGSSANLYFSSTLTEFFKRVSLVDNIPLTLGNNGDYALGYSEPDDSFRIADGTDLTSFPRLTLTASGDIGIGVIDPDTQLEILNAGNQLKLSFDETDNTTFGTDTNGDLTITPSGNDIIFSSNMTLQKNQTVNLTTVNAATYDLGISDYIIHVIYTPVGAVTSLTLLSAQTTAGRIIHIKDAGGNASGNTITIDTEGSETINGSATLILNSDYASTSLYSDGSNWFTF